MAGLPGTIGRYVVLEQVGHGDTGVVYRAHDPVLDRDVVVKVLRDVRRDSTVRHHLSREAQAAARLQHRNIVTIHELGEDAGLSYIAMESLGGRDLEAAILAGEPHTVAEKLDIAIQLCDALDYAHECGIIHRDIKPANVRVLDDGTVKILDFGIARSPDATTEQVAATGTPVYMAPELISGRSVSRQVDVYSAGAVIYELFSGVPPFTGSSIPDILKAILTTAPAPLQDVALDAPDRLAAIVARALEKKTVRRYARASEIASDLRSVRASLVDAPPSSVPLPSAPPSSAPSPRVAASSVASPDASPAPRRVWPWVAIAGLIAAGGLFLLQQRGFFAGGELATAPSPAAPVTAETLAAASVPADPMESLRIVLVNARDMIRSAAAGTAVNYEKIIEDLTAVISALTAQGQRENADLLAQAFELRARARLATGDRRAAEADFAELLKIAPSWTLPADVLPTVTVVFQDVRDRTLKPVASVDPAPPPPASAILDFASPVATSGVAGVPIATAVAAPAPVLLPVLASAPVIAAATTLAPAVSALPSALAPAPSPLPLPPPEPRPVASVTTPVRVGGVVRLPPRTTFLAPVYPPDARARRVVASVLMDVTIGPDGRVRNTETLVSTEAVFAQSAVAAIRRWEYGRPTLDGQPTAIVVRVTVDFSIAPDGKEVVRTIYEIPGQ